MSAPPDCAGDAAAYVLGALTDDEAAAFRGHLVACQSCRDEVETLQAAADALPHLVPQLPARAALRRRVMAEVRRDERAARRARTRRWQQTGVGRLGWAGAGVLMAAGAVVLALVRTSGGTAVRTIQASVAWPGARVVLQISGGHGQLRLHGAPAPPAGHVYEVWVQRGTGSPQPTDALFDVDRAGDATVAVPRSVAGASAVMVTAEPAGGSRHPTSRPVIVARL